MAAAKKAKVAKKAPAAKKAGAKALNPDKAAALEAFEDWSGGFKPSECPWEDVKFFVEDSLHEESDQLKAWFVKQHNEEYELDML